MSKKLIEQLQNAASETENPRLSLEAKAADRIEELEAYTNLLKYAAMEYDIKLDELEQERDELKQTCIDHVEIQNALREQVKMLRSDLKTAADYLDQAATCNSDKAISSQFRKTLTATEQKP